MIGAAVAAIAASLRFLALHARDRAAAGGLARLRVTSSQSNWIPANLVHRRNNGLMHGLGAHPVRQAPVADAVADIDELAAEGRSLLAVTYRLATGLFQEFGRAEALQLTADGNLRPRYWQHQAQNIVKQYAEQHGVDLLDDTVT